MEAQPSNAPDAHLGAETERRAPEDPRRIRKGEKQRRSWPGHESGLLLVPGGYA